MFVYSHLFRHVAALKEKGDNIVLKARERWRAAVGESEFNRLDQFVNTRVARDVHIIAPQDSGRGWRPRHPFERKDEAMTGVPVESQETAAHKLCARNDNFIPKGSLIGLQLSTIYSHLD